MFKKLANLFSKTNDDDHSLKPITPSSQIATSPVLYQWCCNECMAVISSGQVRYKSYEIKGYDLCEECYEKHRVMNSELFREGWFLPETLHRFELKDKVNAPRTNETLQNAFRVFADRPCFGVRKNTAVQYEWFTYRDVHQKVVSFAAGLVSLQLVRNETTASSDREFVAICGRNCLEWFIADYACFHKSLISVPIHYSLTESDMAHVVENAGVSVVVCTVDLTAKYITSASKCPTLKAIIEIGRTNDLDQIRSTQIDDNRCISIYSFEHVEACGKQAPDFQHLVPLGTTNDLITLIYTSGSTGKPKGVMIPDKGFNNEIVKPIQNDLEVSITFCPLAHMSDRKHVAVNIANGARIAIFQRDMEHIFEDIQLVRPTIIVSTPRLWNILFGEYQKQLEHELSSLSKDAPNYDEEKVRIENDVLAQFRTMLGGRATTLVTGGAPTAPAVINFLRKCYRCMVANGFGATEVGGMLSDGNLKLGVEYKLIDVPEMNYFVTDKPHPRGELCVKTDTMFLGYFKNEELTRKALDEDGWYHTQDIVQQLSAKHFKIIDRLKSIFKLAQGEFVAPEYLENVYLASPFIDQIFIYGNTMKSYVVAVIVPQRKVLFQWAKELDIKYEQHGGMEDEQLTWIGTCSETQKLYLSEFHRLASDAQLQPYEIPRGFVLDPVAFTNENGRLTSSNKLARVQCEVYYKKRLEELYSSLQDEETRKISQDLNSLLSQVTGNNDDTSNRSLSELGIDSLHAVRLVNVIKRKYNIDIPMKFMMGKVSLNDVTDYIVNKNNKQSSGSLPISPSEVDWRVEMQLEEEITPTEQSATEVNYDLQSKRCILITGVTGFLGTFLLHELLSSSDCEIYCVVRVKDQQATNAQETAMQRIISELTMNKLWSDQYRGRVHAVVGDLSKPLLGLSNEEFNQLAGEIDVIYHNGAQVNSITPYEELKAVNVLATKEVLRLAVTCRVKIVHYISTIGVVQGVSTSKPISENSSFSDLESENQLFSRLNKISGYSSSKFVAEYLCHEARKRGVPVTIFRPGMIGPDTKSGACNVTDWVIRFIRGCIVLDYYPETGPSRTLDVTPVDLVSRIIVQASQAPQQIQNEMNVYHVVNPKGAIAFDTILRFVQQTFPDLKPCSKFYEWRKILDERLLKLEQEGAHEQDESLWPLNTLFRHGFPQQGGQFLNSNTVKVLTERNQQLLPYPITDEYVHNFVNWMKENLKDLS